MGKIFTAPVSEEQRRQAVEKLQKQEEQLDRDLIIAHLLTEIETLKGLIENDRN